MNFKVKENFKPDNARGSREKINKLYRKNRAHLNRQFSPRNQMEKRINRKHSIISR